ncbi:glycosyltransferase [Mucilaginibacter sp.]|uniref:glycosyltransferase n=1 Tax=Mucilaginibacter sp. TaxID=1882438 RepID=UPI00326412C9
MMRFASMLSSGMEERGHKVELWSPKARFFNLPLPNFLKKWMGYIDQYIVFKLVVRKRLKACPTDTVFVFTDQALGPWVPWVKNRKHVIHCHDFLAQRSALGQIGENPTKWFGKQYQAYIRNGYRSGENFISVSKKTQTDLHSFLLTKPVISRVVYNGLNPLFKPGNTIQSRMLLAAETGIDVSLGYILHIGGNQWYKNRKGVIEIYNAFRQLDSTNLPLLLIGHKPTSELEYTRGNSAFKEDIYFLPGIEDTLLKAAYEGASAFVFPSLAEGFGWPIAEAMASGCPVITTNEAPMTEVAGEAGVLIDRQPASEEDRILWAGKAAKVLKAIVDLPVNERECIIRKGIINSNRFNLETSLNEIEEIYKLI